MRLLLLLALALPSLACSPRACRSAWEQPLIERRLRLIPGVHVDSVGLLNSNGGGSFAWITVNGKGPLAFGYLALDSFQGLKPLPLWQLGHVRPSVVGYGPVGPSAGRTLWSGYSVDVSPSGPFANVLPTTQRTVAEVVAHYDHLLAFVKSWPTCPASTGSVAPDGTELRYCARGPDLASSSPEYPDEWE